MLDAYIIDKIRREEEEQDKHHHLEIQPLPQQQPEKVQPQQNEKRGIEVIDFSI